MKTKPYFIRSYYRIAIPGDLSDDIEVLGQQAITEARERARLWCSTCLWTATKISGEIGDYEVIFRVCRKRKR